MEKKSYSSPEDIHEIAVLRDLYEGLLPPRQREVAHLKFDVKIRPFLKWLSVWVF